MNQGKNNDIIYKVHSFIMFEKNKIIDQNDLIVLNFYNFKYLELVIY